MTDVAPTVSEIPVGDWPAPRAPGSIGGTVTIPGSKSLTNRELILSAIADGPSVLSEPLRARDTDLMAGGLRALGVGITPPRTGAAGGRAR